MGDPPTAWCLRVGPLCPGPARPVVGVLLSGKALYVRSNVLGLSGEEQDESVFPRLLLLPRSYLVKSELVESLCRLSERKPSE